MDPCRRAAFRSLRPQRRRVVACGLSLPMLLLSLSVVSGPLLAMPPAACAIPPPYPEAVAQGRQAARAVLANAGRESCLRGKLTRALLLLSDSCAAARQTGPLCTLADRAVVVTPMSLTFMRDTSSRLLEILATGS
jgi:hypothetical protein